MPFTLARMTLTQRRRWQRLMEWSLDPPAGTLGFAAKLARDNRWGRGGRPWRLPPGGGGPGLASAPPGDPQLLGAVLPPSARHPPAPHPFARRHRGTAAVAELVRQNTDQLRAPLWGRAAAGSLAAGGSALQPASTQPGSQGLLALGDGRHRLPGRCFGKRQGRPRSDHSLGRDCDVDGNVAGGPVVAAAVPAQRSRFPGAVRDPGGVGPGDVRKAAAPPDGCGPWARSPATASRTHPAGDRLLGRRGGAGGGNCPAGPAAAGGTGEGSAASLRRKVGPSCARCSVSRRSKGCC